jgi:type ISP restriction-modification system protein
MKVRSVGELVRSTLSRPGQSSYLLLRFRPTADELEDHSLLSQALPWLPELGRERAEFCDDLRRHGLGVVACAGAKEARRLLRQIRGRRLFAQVFAHRGAAGRATLIRARHHGVYATPAPLVGYLVRSVHRLLQDRLGWNAGLADPAVRLLDPAAGSMNFLRAAWRLALEAHWHRGGEAADLIRTHLLPHFLGIELQATLHVHGLANLSRFLGTHGYAPGAGEALPGALGDALAPASELLDFPANVVLGNPPWCGRSSHQGDWITALLKGYRRADGRDDGGYFRVDGRPLRERNSKWLHDDAVKFLRLAQWKIDQAGEGIAALVLPHNGLDAPTFRGLRRLLRATVDEIYTLDLHGNRRKRERSPDGGPDENVFAGIGQGVALFLLVKRQGLPQRVLRADLYGSRRSKLAALATSHVGTTGWQEVEPRSPSYLLVVADRTIEREYLRGIPLPEVFPLSSTGVITGRDSLAVALDRRSLVERLRALCREGGNDLRLDAGRRQQLCRDPAWRRRIRSFLARPFDRRFLLDHDALVERPRRAAMAHMAGGTNLALVASRQARGEPGALVTRWIAGHKAVSAYDVSSLFPLHLVDGDGRVPNLAPDLLARLAECHGVMPQPDEVLGYVYAVLYDPAYRERYRTLLRQDFARIPYPAERGLFTRLAALGGELIGLHLLADERLRRPPVRLVGSLSDGLGWGRRTLLNYREAEGRLYVNAKGSYFEGIAPEVLRYGIGDHPVLARWLTARAGRALRPGESRTFCRIASALVLTIDVQTRIAEATAGLRGAA